MKKNKLLSTEELQETLDNINEIVVVIDKIFSGFDDHKTMAAALLLFFSEKNALDKLAHIRRYLYDELESRLPKDEYDEWIERDPPIWKPPYNETESSILKKLGDAFLWEPLN